VITVRPPALLFGIPVADLTMREALDVIGSLVDDGRRLGRSHQIATVNVDFLVNALEHVDLHATLRNAALNLADGAPIVSAAKLLQMPIAERVAGADLVPMLVDRSQQTGWRIHFFGSAPQVADQAAALLHERYPAADFTVDSGPMMSDVTRIDDAVIDSIRDRDPDILCVALGNPKQEHFIRAHRDRLGTPVSIGIGGSLDMLVGHRKRAPLWMQRVGLEWIARAVQEPARLGPRYAHDIRVFFPRLVGEIRSNRKRRSHGVLVVDVGAEAVRVSIAPATAATGDRRRSWTDAARALESGAALHLSACSAASLQDPELARLVGLAQIARRTGCTVGVESGSVPLVDELRRVDADPRTPPS
jgi:N-acetylglucosaminyldiphosphoundecaprenol N-acetyl-beta-D-mannosaminyltransferase